VARGGNMSGSTRAGSTAKRTVKRAAPRPRDHAIPGSVSPVDVLLGMMRGDLAFDDARFKAAIAAAPYVHARRGTAEPTGADGVRHEDALKELE
jgi:hypothetical protein